MCRAGNRPGLTPSLRELTQTQSLQKNLRIVTENCLRELTPAQGQNCFSLLRVCCFVCWRGLRRARRARIRGWGKGHQNPFLLKTSLRRAYARTTRPPYPRLRCGPWWIFACCGAVMAADGNKMYTYTNVLTHRVDHDASCTMCAWWRNNDEEADADDNGQQTGKDDNDHDDDNANNDGINGASHDGGRPRWGVISPPSAITALSNRSLRCIRKAYYLSGGVFTNWYGFSNKACAAYAELGILTSSMKRTQLQCLLTRCCS